MQLSKILKTLDPLVIAGVLSLACANLRAATFTVTNTARIGPGSLNQAIIDANANPGLDTIAFAIPPFDGTVKTISPTNALPTITNAVIIDGYTQPGASANTLANDNDAVLLIELEGSGIAVVSVGLSITAGNSTVRGLVINRCNSTGISLSTVGTNVIEGNFIGTDPSGTVARPNAGSGITISSGQGNTFGGTTPAARNLISGGVNRGMFFTASGHNMVRGNFIGTDRHGTTALGNGGPGIDISNPASGTNIIGGTTTAARNIIAANRSDGITIVSAAGNIIQGNFIGTDVTGTKRLTNSSDGISISGASNLIGGTVSGAGNLISGNNGSGVFITGNSNRVEGNFIGTDITGTLILSNAQNGIHLANFAVGNLIGGAAAGAGNLISGNGLNGVNAAGAVPVGVTRTVVQGNIIGADITGNNPLPNGDNGVRIFFGRIHTIGGTNAGEGNRIVYNKQVGVSIEGGGDTTNAILGNAIFANGGLGIDLFAVTTNDLCDADSGANAGQNYPVLTRATNTAGGVLIEGTLNSAANTAFRIEFFASSSCDPSGFGEGQIFLGSTNVSTDGSCNTSFANFFSTNIPGCWVITATATDPNGNTSEFSQCVPVRGASESADLAVTMTDAPDPVNLNSNFTYTIVVTNNGACSATGVKVTDVLPAGVMFVAASAGCANNGGTVTCNVGSLAVGVRVTNTITVKAISGATINNTASVMSDQTDSVSGNNAATVSTTVNAAAPCTITCAANVTTTNASGQCGANVSYAAPVTSGSCSAVTCSPISGSFFPVGTTTVSCTATGGANCSFTVTVLDRQAPAIACPPNMVLSTSPGLCSRTNVTFSPTVSDNCSGTTVVCTPPSSSTFAKGATTVRCTATDGAGNTNTCSFTVTINDTEAPVITCPTNLVVTTTPGQCVASNVTFTVTATDNCPGVTVVSTPPSGSTFAKGTNVVTSVATDAAGNTNRCTFAVIVIDVEPPTITCSTNVIVAAPAGQSSVVANYPVPIFSDHCPGASGACSPPSGSTFPVGTTTVTCTAGDSSSNTTTCTFTVAVTSTATNSPPVALCRNVTNSVGTNCLAALAVAAVDDGSFDPDGTIASRTINPAGPLSPGTHTITLTVIDNQGASNSCSATVTILDATPPAISCPANIVTNAAPGQTAVNVTFATPSATDNCGTPTVVCMPASGSAFAIGTSTVICTATDGGNNTNSCAFTVTVISPATNSPPVAVCRSLTTNAVGNCQVSLAAADLDNGSLDPDGTIASRTITPPGPFGPGTHIVTLTVTDNRGASDSCVTTLIVVDAAPPALVCPPDLATNLPAGESNAVVNFPIPTATDACGSVTVACLPPSGATFSSGTTPVVCVATDPAGNSNTCAFNVTVSQGEPETHDLAILSMTVPKLITLKANGPTVTKRVKVKIQNRSAHTETIPTLDVLANLVTVQGTNLASACTAPVVTFVHGPPNHAPRTLKSKSVLNIFFDVTFTPACVPDPLKGRGHEDFTWFARVNHDALDGKADTHPECDVCPRTPVPEPNPNGKIKDKGCGAAAGHGLFGNPVLTDLFLKR